MGRFLLELEKLREYYYATVELLKSCEPSI